MNQQKILRGFSAIMLMLAVGIVPAGCPTWRTQHEVATTHKVEIDAHIQLDIRNIEANAEQIVKEVREEPLAGKPMSYVPQPARVKPERTIWSIFDISTGAYAADSDEDEAKSRMRARAVAIDGWLSKRCIGESNIGLLEMRPCDECKSDAAKKQEVSELVAAENRDRMVIYRAEAHRQGIPESRWKLIGQTFAGVYLKSLKSGQPFQIPVDGAFYDRFIMTDVGKKFRDAPKGSWVVVP